MLQHHSSRIPRRLVLALSAGAVVSFVFLVTCVWCNDWGLRGSAREDKYEDGEHLGSPLQRHMAAYGAPGRGGPMLWLWNLVDPAGPRHECQALRRIADPLRNIAIVGNGPITAYQRRQIEEADVVVRFNKLDNWYCGDRLDVWVTRWANHVVSKYHGIGEVEFCNTSLAAGMASAVWILDAVDAKHAKQLAEAEAKYAPVRRPGLAKTVVDWPRMEALFHARVPGAPPKSIPSSGWAAMMLALECAPPRARVHLFGFNWSRRAWAAHKMGAEEAFARALDAAGRIRIHWPACAGMRGCGGCPIVASYDADGGAVCVARPPGPPGEGEALRAAKFAKDNAWLAAVDRQRPPAVPGGGAAGGSGLGSVLGLEWSTEVHGGGHGVVVADVALGEEGVAAAVRQHLVDPTIPAKPMLPGESGEAGAPSGGEGGARETLEPRSSDAGDRRAGAVAAAVARRSRLHHRAMRSPRALRWALRE